MDFFRMNDNYQRFDEIMDGVFGGGTYNVDPNNYPSFLEPPIQKAVQCKRNGNYDEAIDIYLKIFEQTGRVWPAIMEFLYKSALCGGELELAYSTIVYAEIFAKKCWGMNHPFFGEWSQALKRKEFESVLLETRRYQTISISRGELSKDESNAMVQNFIKKTKLMETLASKYSGSMNYNMPSIQNSSFENCYNMYNEFHRQYGDTLGY